MSARVKDPAAYVNPFLGTGSGGPLVGEINTFPDADAPFGMIQWGPVTNNPDPRQPLVAGYEQGATRIKGFSLTHLSGAGCPIYGDVPIMPHPGVPHVSPVASPGDYEVGFSPSGESASPGSYSVRLADGVDVSLAVSTRAGLGTFSFPPGHSPTMMFDISGSENGVFASDARILGVDEVAGYATSGDFCGADDRYSVYFVARFDRPFSSSGAWRGSALAPGAKGASGTHGGIYVTFPRCTCRQAIRMQVAISYTGTAGAEENLRAADLGFDLSSVSRRVRARWNSMLTRVSIAGGTLSQQRLFYSLLYHSLLFPSVFSDANGDYIGFDGKIHTARSYPQYANYSEWDIYRSEVPLLALVAPRELAGMMQSLVRDYDQSGWLPRWPVANGETNTMGGDSADPIIANAMAFGVRGFDTSQAFGAMVKGASIPGSGPGGYVERPGLASYIRLGYVPDSSRVAIETSSASLDGASLTLEYAEDDFAVSRVAGMLAGGPGSAADRCGTVDRSCQALESAFLGRSGNWRNVFDPAFDEDVPRTTSGSFLPGWPAGTRVLGRALAIVGDQGVGQEGFQEGDSKQYTWLVPQDLGGLFGAMGGDAAVQRRLGAYFTHTNAGPLAPYDWSGNEPDLEAPWEGDYAGAPGLTERVVHEILARHYSDTPAGEPGNDDLGAISSWAIWAMLGLYPETPGVPVLVTGSPTFPWARVSLAGGRTLTLVAPRHHPSSIYVSSMKLDGAPHDAPWLDFATLPPHATVAFDLTRNSAVRWGTAPGDAPPSFSS